METNDLTTLFTDLSQALAYGPLGGTSLMSTQVASELMSRLAYHFEESDDADPALGVLSSALESGVPLKLSTLDALCQGLQGQAEGSEGLPIEDEIKDEETQTEPDSEDETEAEETTEDPISESVSELLTQGPSHFTVDEVLQVVPKMTTDDLSQLLLQEQEGKNRITLIDALEIRLLELGAE